MFRQSLSLVAVIFLWALPLEAARIVSLLPSNTEILDALGAGDEIVGITRFDRVVAGRHVIGDFFQPNLETIASLSPDLIVAGLSASNRSTQRLRKMGYRVVEIRNPRSLDELYESIRELGRVVQRPDEAERVVREMKVRLEAVRVKSSKFPRRLRTYLEIDSPFWAIGGKDFLAEAIGYAGLDNIFSDLQRPSAQVSPEVVVQRNPELIIVFDTPANHVARRPGWSSITAVKKGWILDRLDRDALARPSPQLVTGIEALVNEVEALVR